MTPTNESRPKWHSRRITPPFPSPPRFELTSFILFTTLISPTADRITTLPLDSASLSKAKEEERLRTKFSLCFISLRYPSAAKTIVYSSPKGSPVSLTIANLSASGSTAKPTSARCLFTIFLRSIKFSGNGSVPLVKFPSGSQFNSITSHPKACKTAGNACDPAPFIESITTLNFLF